MEFQTKTDYAFAALRDAIVTGRLKPGDWIRSQEWADDLQVSQIPVREALSRLQAQGLVEIHPHRGAQVMGRSLAHVSETYLIRAALESLAARVAIENATDADFPELVAEAQIHTATMAKALDDNDMAVLRQANRAMHMGLYARSKLPRLVQLIESLWVTYPFDTLNIVPGRPAQAVDEHYAILKCIRDRDAEGLAAAMATHLKNAQEALVSASPDAFVEQVGTS